MLKLRRTKTADSGVAPTTLHLDSGTPLVEFPPEIISNYRRLITGLLYQGGIPPRIALVGSLRGEGVTYSTLALATALALDLPSRIGVVELNWWSPGLANQLLDATRPLGKKGKHKPLAGATDSTDLLPTSLGLSAVLEGKTSIDEALIHTGLPNLSLLPAGIMSVEQRSIVARSTALQDVITDLSTRFDHVLLDIPALLVNSDAIALASLADVGCMVVRQGITPVNMIKLALDEVKHLRMLGVIMNKTRIHMPGWLYNLIPQE